MNKQEYVKQLLDRLAYMISENERANKTYIKLLGKVGSLEQTGMSRWEAVNHLSYEDRDLYWKNGKIYSKSSIQRIRIELNTVLIELEKGE